MILDLQRFLEREQPGWQRLERLLDRCQPGHAPLALEDWDLLRELYERAGWGLARLQQGASPTAVGTAEHDLGRLVARAYGEIYGQRERWRRPSLGAAVVVAAGAWTRFPRVFRAHARLFALSLALLLAGAGFGGAAVAHDPAAVDVLLPQAYLAHPAQRVAQERTPNPLLTPGNESVFAAELMTHNIQVALVSLFLGVTWGIGTALLLFYNGLMLGAVAVHYGLRGYGGFVAAWLLPHGVIEIPAILIGGQGGLLLAAALLRPGSAGRRRRLRAILPDLVTLGAGLSGMLIWAGLIEAFYSQYHGPSLTMIKILFGVVELAALIAYLSFTGRGAGGAADGARREGA